MFMLGWVRKSSPSPLQHRTSVVLLPQRSAGSGNPSFPEFEVDSLTTIMKRRYPRRKKISNHRDAGASHAGQDAPAPMKLKIHRSIIPVLDRIKVPEQRPFIPDPFQTEALEALESADVLVTAPTGAGKTYIAIEAIRKIFNRGGRSWYASPLKALSNAKFSEFCELFGSDNVGILTGDRKENPQAPIIVGTTEILRNQLYDIMHRGEDLEEDLVVLDEAHYLGDEDRGVVWEEVLIYLPSRVRLLLLSATIRNAEEICDWLKWLRKTPCRWVCASERPVPLYPLFLFPTGELTPLGTRRGLFPRIRALNAGSFPRHQFPNVSGIMKVLQEANLLPAIFFLKSRADCEKAVSLCQPLAGDRKSQKKRAFSKRLEELLDEYPFLKTHQHLSILRTARVGAHHGGQLPHWKLLLEKLMQEGHLHAIFSTSTVAAGVNFPARTVVIFQSDRFNGKEFSDLTATDLLQMTGRAGRRGMDEIGFVLVIPGPFQDPQLIHAQLLSPPDAIESRIRVNFSMVLNLLLSHTPEEIRTLFSFSLATHQNVSRESHVASELERAQHDLEDWTPEMACGSLEKLQEIRPHFALLDEQLRKARKAWKRQASEEPAANLLAPGRVFLTQRGTPYVVLHHPDPDRRRVEAVRLGLPLRFKRGRLRTYHVGFHRLRHLGEMLEDLPPLTALEAWEEIAESLSQQPFKKLGREETVKGAPALEAAAGEMKNLILQKASLPCTHCELYGPCIKSASHPFSAALNRYLWLHSQVQTIQERLWQSFLQHFRILQDEGYVDAEGRLTHDGMWACELRLDQPLLISDCIRKGVFPDKDPALLAGLIAPFVMDRERPGEMQLSRLVWKFPELARPFFTMLNSLQPLRRRLEAEGFHLPTLPFWALVTVHLWANGAAWEEVRSLFGVDEGDLAMVILRTADHLRQIESLGDTHPQLAKSARAAIEMILREPVLVD